MDCLCTDTTSTTTTMGVYCIVLVLVVYILPRNPYLSPRGLSPKREYFLIKLGKLSKLMPVLIFKTFILFQILSKNAKKKIPPSRWEEYTLYTHATTSRKPITLAVSIQQD